MSTGRKELSGAEFDTLKTLWAQGPGSAGDIREALDGAGRSWAYTTAKTVLDRLVAKGYVRSDRSREPHVYEASVSRAALARQRLDDIRKGLFAGRSVPFMRALVEAADLKREEIAALRASLDEAATAAKSRRRP